MEDSMPLDKLLQLLKKPQSGRRLIHVLTNLRKHVNAPNHQQAIEFIKKFNSLKQLIGCTQFDSNLRVVDLVLSILGNCCTNPSVVRQVVNDLNILPNLLRVLEKHKKDSFYGRIFRIFGNVYAAMEPIMLMQKDPKVVTATLNFLKNYALNKIGNGDVSFSVPTVSMALRFVRKLITIQTFTTLVQQYSLIPILGLVLIKCSKQWVLNKNDDVLVNDLLKILQIITATAYKYNNLIPEMKNTENGDSLQSLADIILLQPERLTKVILRLARASKNLSDLPIESIITTLVTQVETQPPNVNGSQSHLLFCVNNLIGHFGFQDIFKNADIVTKLVKLLQIYCSTDVEDWSVQACIYIAQSLTKCQFNEYLVQSQLSANIIPIIVEKLAYLTGKSTEKITIQTHDKKDYKIKTKAMNKRIKLQLKRDERDCDRERDKPNESRFGDVVGYLERDRCASPDSCSDISSCGPFSPAATSNFTGDDSDSDNYSPLCSETECDDEYKEDNEDVQLTPSDTDDNRPHITQDQIILRNKLRSELCSLLKIYCTVKPLHPHLGDTKVITIITNLMLDSFINEEMHEKEFSIVKAICLARDFFIPFMSTDIIAQVYEVRYKRQIDCCSDCDRLQGKAERIIANFLNTGSSESIKGHIASILLGKDNAAMKENLSLAIPYVIRNKISLVDLLLDCGGLNILIGLLQGGNKQMQSKSIKSICTLAAVNLKVKNPVRKSLKALKTKITNSNSSSVRVKIGKYSSPEPEHCNNEVIFRLDDGSTVKADRDALIDKSDYFRALFSGMFVESQTNEITLKDVTNDALCCMLEFFKHTIKPHTSFDIDYKLETILEVVLLSDRFLLCDLNEMLSCYVEQLISAKTVPTIYKWSLESATNMLRIESIAFALVNENTYSDKVALFAHLLELGYNGELLGDVRKLICQFLRPRMENIDC